jgi:stearoyl-CoA desaturase (delta-9 desaturase)
MCASRRITPIVQRRKSAMPGPAVCTHRGSVEHLSLALLFGMHAACVLVFFVPFSPGVVALCVGGYLLRMWAITAGYHRYFSHRAFKTSRVFQFLLALIGTSAMENGPIWWASWHRHHHRFADMPEDLHSPTQRGFWHAHMGWVLSTESDHPDTSNVEDLKRFPELRLLDRHKWLPLIGYAVACYAIAGAAGLVWGFALSSVLVLHATALINSLGHLHGSRPYATHDTARNNPLLALITLGEGWHNNHHHAQSSARQGFLWWEIDLTYYALTVLSWFGIVWELRKPSARALGATVRRAQLNTRATPGSLQSS